VSLRERIAQALGWSVEDTQGLSFQTLRELVRDKDPKLAEEISRVIRSGAYIRQP